MPDYCYYGRSDVRIVDPRLTTPVLRQYLLQRCPGTVHSASLRKPSRTEHFSGYSGSFNTQIRRFDKTPLNSLKKMPEVSHCKSSLLSLIWYIKYRSGHFGMHTFPLPDINSVFTRIMNNCSYNLPSTNR
jgi:hypothetical protein